jgi:hypothetical protein
MWAAPALGAAILACDTTSVSEFEPQVVVEAYIVAGEPLRQVRVTRTVSVDELYDPVLAALNDAEVEISLLDQSGAVEDTYPFVLSADPGVYVPLQSATVLPLREYRLQVRTPLAPEPVTSETTVPGLFEVIEISADSLTYQGDEQFEVRLTRSTYPGRQSIFVFSTESLDPTVENLTPLYREIAVGDDDSIDPADLQEFLVNESPPFNEGNYTPNPDGTLTIQYPWIALAFYGPNRIIANALDDNLFDYLRSQSIQQQPSTLSPGTIPNIIDRVEGGTGVFGSFARSVTEIYVLSP